jgi:hypothetical protein
VNPEAISPDASWYSGENATALILSASLFDQRPIAAKVMYNGGGLAEGLTNIPCRVEFIR